MNLIQRCFSIIALAPTVSSLCDKLAAGCSFIINVLTRKVTSIFSPTLIEDIKLFVCLFSNRGCQKVH